MKRILVVKLADLGDVLSATPALRALRQTWPQAQIDLLVTPGTRSLVQGLPGIDNVISFDKFAFDYPRNWLTHSPWTPLAQLTRQLRRQNYDTVIVLHHLTLRFGTLKYAALVLASGAPQRVGLDNGRGWFFTHRALDHGFGARHEVEYWLDTVAAIGAHTTDTRLEMPCNQADSEFAQTILGERRPIVLHPGSGGYSLARRWQPQGFAYVADKLLEAGYPVALVGRAEDGGLQVRQAMRHANKLLDLTGKTTVTQLGAILRHATLFVGSDSGVMHMAVASGSPVVAIFGPTNPQAWGPWRAGTAPVRIVRTPMPCSPCAYVGGRVGQREGCEARWCLAWVGAEQVLMEAQRLLELSLNVSSES